MGGLGCIVGGLLWDATMLMLLPWYGRVAAGLMAVIEEDVGMGMFVFQMLAAGAAARALRGLTGAFLALRRDTPRWAARVGTAGAGLVLVWLVATSIAMSSNTGARIAALLSLVVPISWACALLAAGLAVRIGRRGAAHRSD